MRAGQSRAITLDLIEPHSRLGQCWFWTAVAVVATARTTTALLVTRDRPSNGNFNPSAIGAPLVRF